MGLEDILGQVLEQAGDGSSGRTGGGGGGLNDLLGGLLGGGGSAGSGAGGAGGVAGMAGIAAALTPMIGSFLKGGGLEKLLSSFQNAGMGNQAKSWVGTGANEPVNAAQVDQALAPEQIDDVARQLGVSHEQAAALLAGVIPGVVDKVTPDGHVPTTEELAAQLGG